MKFKTQTTDLAKALNAVGVVTPAAVNSKGAAGFLFVPREDRCYIYSEDEHQKARVDFPITDLEGEGSFVYPAGPMAFQHLEGWVELEASEKDGDFLVKYTTEGGASKTMPSFDPRALQALDKDLSTAKDGSSFPAALLREALLLGKGYVAEPSDNKTPDHFKSFQLFNDSKDEWKAGNGHLFAADGYQAFYFWSQEFEGKAFNIHALRTNLVTSFLAKSKGLVQIKNSERSSYFVNEEGMVIGWSDPVAEHAKFGFYPHAKDTHVLRIDKAPLLKALAHIKVELGKGERVRVVYNAQKMTLQFFANDNGSEISSIPCRATPVDSDDGADIKGGAKGKTDNLAFNVNVDWFSGLLASIKEHLVELRVCVSGTNHMIRTVENFHLDSAGKSVLPTATGEQTYPCRVTRYMSSMV